VPSNRGDSAIDGASAVVISTSVAQCFERGISIRLIEQAKIFQKREDFAAKNALERSRSGQSGWRI